MESCRLEDKLEEVGTLESIGDLIKILQYLWKAKYAALDVIIRRETKSHKTLPQTTSQRLNTHSVSVKVDPSKLENYLEHNLLVQPEEG